MSLFSILGEIGSGFIGFFLKLMIVLLSLVFFMGLVVALVTNWPFTICLIIGLLLSEQFYRRLSRKFNVRLPKYFYINIEDFLATFNEGDEDVSAIKADLISKRRIARKEVLDMKDALQSVDEQLGDIKTKRSLKTLFKRPISDISPRAAKALEMELGKPRWVQHIEKAGKSSNGEWDKLMA